jgi:hypothetical protein
MPGIHRTISNPQKVIESVNSLRNIASQYPDLFIQNQMQVITKEALSVPFKYNWSQLQVAANLARQKEDNKPIRAYVLKSRQVGLSTQIAARGFVNTWANDNYESLIIAHQEIRAKELLDRVKGFYISLHPKLQLSLAQDSKAGIKFADTRGSMTIVSAKNIHAARGGTKQFVLFSEFAYYPKPINILTEIEQLVARSPKTEIIIETTGFGRGSSAHDFWLACKAGYENYECIFLPWQDDPGNDYKFMSEKERDYALRAAFDYEPKLQDKMTHFNLGPGQTYTAFLILKDQCHGDWNKFCQEYPCDDEEAWRATGECYFGTENLNILRPEQFPFEFKVFGPKAPLGQEFEALSELEAVDKVDEKANRPYFKIWKYPQSGSHYIIGSDSAEGLEDGNFSSSFVMDMYTYEMMAEFHGKVRPDEHAYIIASLGNIYNAALAAPEYNAPGNATLQELKKIYPNIYRWKYIDDYKPRESNKMGWQTNSTTRPLMLALCKRLVEDLARGRLFNPAIIKSGALVDEMRTFVVQELDGRAEAAPGCQDDRVFAWAICCIVASQETYGSTNDILSMYKKKPVEEKPLEMTNLPILSDPADVISRFYANPNDSWMNTGEYGGRIYN